MTYATKVDQEKLDYGFLVLTHIVCADQQINSEKLKYLEELGAQRNISERTKDEMKRILADNNQSLKVDYIETEKIMQQILATFYKQGLFGFSEQEAIMRIASVCNWSQKGIKRVIQEQGFKIQTNNNGSSQKVTKTPELISPEIEKKLVEELQNLPESAEEGEVDKHFISRSFFDALGFTLFERATEFQVGIGHKKVDYALRHNTDDDDSFLTNKVNPYILVELKKRAIDLAYNKPDYKKTVKQIKDYLLAPNCKSVQWGIITNSKHIQLFRKHGKVIYPATTCLEIKPDNIVDITHKIKKKINNPSRALTVAVYNNKGGVGKTTTVINLAATLTRKNKKVLVVDFDPNQKDLTESLGIKPQIKTLYDCLNDKKNLIDLKEVISPYTQSIEGEDLIFDVIPVDKKLAGLEEHRLRQEFTFYSLRKKLESLKSSYDYILIDSPPNWRFYSISAVYAAEVVLIPTKHNNIRSLKNAATSIHKYIPEIQQARQEKTQGLEWGAVALPIFFNNERNIPNRTSEQAIEEINSIINQVKHEYNFDLRYYFFSRYDNKDEKKTKIFEMPYHAFIASYYFDKIPAVYKSRIVYDYYTELAKEYFLQ